MTQDRPYEGQELELFAHALNWKKYWSGSIRRDLGRSVAEIGAGLGANTPYLLGSGQDEWLCVEPDASLSARIPAALESLPRREIVTTLTGTLGDLPPGRAFDTILYIDVLEHIEDDRTEMKAAYARLNPGGKIIVLSPAWPQLYTEFDRAIGHFRRYTRASLRDCTPPGAQLVRLFALDSFGLMASVANKMLLHQSMPSLKQIGFWDRVLVPISRVTDALIGYSAGKSLIAVWQKPG